MPKQIQSDTRIKGKTLHYATYMYKELAKKPRKSI
jgi:hypothetical protein